MNTLLQPDSDYERLSMEVDGHERLRLLTGEFSDTIVDCRLSMTSETPTINFNIVSSNDSDLAVTNTGLQQRVSDIVASIFERGIANAEGRDPTNPTTFGVIYDSES